MWERAGPCTHVLVEYLLAPYGATMWGEDTWIQKGTLAEGLSDCLSFQTCLQNPG